MPPSAVMIKQQLEWYKLEKTVPYLHVFTLKFCVELFVKFETIDLFHEACIQCDGDFTIFNCYVGRWFRQTRHLPEHNIHTCKRQFIFLFLRLV